MAELIALPFLFCDNKVKVPFVMNGTFLLEGYIEDVVVFEIFTCCQ